MATVRCGGQPVLAVAARNTTPIKFCVDRAERTIVRGEFRSADEALLLAKAGHALPGLRDLTLQRRRARTRNLVGDPRVLDPSLGLIDAGMKRSRRLHILGALYLGSSLLPKGNTGHHQSDRTCGNKGERLFGKDHFHLARNRRCSTLQSSGPAYITLRRCMAGERADKPVLELGFRMGSFTGPAQLFPNERGPRTAGAGTSELPPLQPAFPKPFSKRFLEMASS